MAKLTPEHVQILAYMARTRDDHVCANWIAESCGHFYETEWASKRLPTLLRAALIEKGARGWYRITSAGRAKLTVSGDTK